MNRSRWIALIVVCLAVIAPAVTFAQPGRQIPGTRPHLPGSPPATFPEANSRTRAAQSGVGLESTDFYGKKGYPKILGDSVETSTNSGASAAGTTGGGNTGVQSAGSAGFQGNTGNQIGQQGGGTVLGGLFGLTNNLGGNGFAGNQQPGAGLTGGGFSGMVPKGFGFGGTPDFTRSWTTTPMSGVSGR